MGPVQRTPDEFFRGMDWNEFGIFFLEASRAPRLDSRSPHGTGASIKLARATSEKFRFGPLAARQHPACWKGEGGAVNSSNVVGISPYWLLIAHARRLAFSFRDKGQLSIDGITPPRSLEGIRAPGVARATERARDNGLPCRLPHLRGLCAEKIQTPRSASIQRCGTQETQFYRTVPLWFMFWINGLLLSKLSKLPLISFSSIVTHYHCYLT